MLTIKKKINVLNTWKLKENRSYLYKSKHKFLSITLGFTKSVKF